MHTIVSEARVTLDTRFLCKDVIVLPFKVANNFRKAVDAGWLASAQLKIPRSWASYLASLSTWSPNPGVSTIVSEMRVPSSSNSSSKNSQIIGSRR